MNASGVSAGRLEAVGFGLLAVLACVPLAEVWRVAPDLRHGWAAVLLAGYLWWERAGARPVERDGDRGSGTAWGLLGALLIAIAVPLRLVLTPFPEWTTALWAYLGLLLGIGCLAEYRRAGWAGVRWLAGPALVFAGALPWPSIVNQWAIQPMRETMAALAAELGNLAGRPALAVGTAVRLPAGWVGIDEACGGIRSLQACVMIALFLGEWFRFSVGRRVILLAAATGAAMAGNFARVTFLTLAAGRGEAVEAMHDAAAWCALGVSLAATGWFACRWNGWRWPADPVGVCRAGHVQAGGRWWLVCCAFGVLAGELATRRWYAAGGGDGGEVRWQWTAVLPEAHPSYVAEPLSEPAAEMLRPDGFRAGRWRGEAGEERAAYYVEWRSGQAARSVPFAHNPSVCLPLAGCELEAELGTFELMRNGVSIPFRALRFSQRGEEMWVAFTIWDPARKAALADSTAPFERQAWLAGRWREVAERRAVQPAQLFTLAIIGGKGEPLAALQDELRALIHVP